MTNETTEERWEREQQEREDFHQTVGGGDLYEHLHGAHKPPVENVAAVMRKRPEPPVMAVPGWLVKDELHWVASEAEAGKTWLALWLAIAVMTAEPPGRVAYFDEELGVVPFAERLLALGANPDVVEERFAYAPFPAWDMSDADVAAHRDFLRALKPALVVYDTATDMLAEAGLDENSGVDVTRWVKTYPEQARQVGAAQLVLDHVGLSDGAKNRAVGSRAKRAKAKVGYTIKLKTAYDSATVGHVRIERTKNTRGADIPPVRDYSVGSTPFAWELMPTPTAASLVAGVPGAARIEAVAKARTRVLTKAPRGRENAVNKTALRSMAGGNATHTGNAIDELVEHGALNSELDDKQRVVYWQDE